MSDRKKRLARRRFTVLEGEGKRFSFANFKQAALFYVLLFLAFVVIIQLGYHWLGEQFLAWRLQIVEAEPGVLNEEILVKGMINRDERIVGAPDNVVVLYLAEDGQRVSAGEELARLGIVTADQLEALRGNEEEEPDEDLWQQLQDYWDGLFNNDSLTEEKTDSISGEDMVEQPPARAFYDDVIILYAEEPGFFSLYTDHPGTGDSSFQTGDRPPEDSEKQVDDASADKKFSPVLQVGDLVPGGEPLYKMVNNWEWRFKTTLPSHPGRILAEKERIDIEFSFAPGVTVSAMLIEADSDSAAGEITLTYLIDHQLFGFDKVRTAEARLLYGQKRGIIVPGQSVFDNESGESGIYINREGRVVFVPVTVIARQDQMALVEGVDVSSMVISRPDFVEEGQRFR